MTRHLLDRRQILGLLGVAPTLLLPACSSNRSGGSGGTGSAAPEDGGAAGDASSGAPGDGGGAADAGSGASLDGGGPGDASSDAPADAGTRAADVLVIGAGIAGLRAAEVLVQEGKSVIVLEARDRIGGRIHTDRSWGVPLEMGASWIHGVTNNPIAQRAAAAGIATRPCPYNEALYNANATRRPDGDVATIETLVNQLANSGRASTPSSDEPLRAALDRAIAAKNLTASQLLDVEFGITSVFEHEYGADATQLSSLHFDDGADDLGGDALIPGGYDQIVNLVAKGLDIRLNTVVTSIDQTSQPVVVHTKQGDFTAKAVIVTVPLGVLQAGAIQFIPSLSATKAAAIQRLGMRAGSLTRAYLRFPTIFWPNANYDLVDRVPPAGERAHWIESLNASELEAIAALSMFNAGAFGRTVEAMNDQDALTSAMAALTSMFGSAAVAPSAILRSSWTLDPYSNGSYSYIPVGSSNADCTTLGAPEGAIFFAGEACNPDHNATVHGAYTSGESAASSAALLAKLRKVEREEPARRSLVGAP